MSNTKWNFCFAGGFFGCGVDWQSNRCRLHCCHGSKWLVPLLGSKTGRRHVDRTGPTIYLPIQARSQGGGGPPPPPAINQSSLGRAKTVLMNRTFEYKDPKTMVLLYKSLVRPHLEYANQIWVPHLMKHIIALENVQRRATKMIPGLKNLDYTQRLKTLQLPTLSFRRIRGDMIETYKILTGKYDRDVTEGLLKLRGGNDTRGHSLKLYKERARKFSFPFRVTDPWNSLTEHVINAPTVFSFESRRDRLWGKHKLN